MWQTCVTDGRVFFSCDFRDEFAYCSADKLVYIRSFSEDGSEMKLKAVLQGHEAEVTQVRWNNIHQKWVTGSDDCTIRVWVCPFSSYMSLKNAISLKRL